MQPEELETTSEFYALKGECKFNNCLHVDEPQCAVKQAVEDESIAPRATIATSNC